MFDLRQGFTTLVCIVLRFATLVCIVLKLVLAIGFGARYYLGRQYALSLSGDWRLYL